MKIIDKVKLKLYIKLYTNLYHRISFLAINFNNGIHPKHRIMKYYQFFIDNIEGNSKVLDVGCGHGYVAYKVAEKAQKVVAIDISKNHIELAKKIHQKINIIYLVGDATKFQFEEKFDYIILSNILEHIKKRIEFLNKFKSLTKFFLIRVPLISRSWLPLYIKELGMDYRLDNSHQIEYSIESFQKEIKLAGLKIISYKIKFGELWAKIKLQNNYNRN